MRTLEDRFESYKKAVQKLNEIITIYDNNKEEYVIDAMIQRFEFCVELAWKLIRDYLIREAVGEFNSPRLVIKQAYKLRLITEGELWLDMLEDRNLTSHTYDEIIANTIRDNILNNHNVLLNDLKDVMEEKVYER